MGQGAGDSVRLAPGAPATSGLLAYGLMWSTLGSCPVSTQ